MDNRKSDHLGADADQASTVENQLQNQRAPLTIEEEVLQTVANARLLGTIAAQEQRVKAQQHRIRVQQHRIRVQQEAVFRNQAVLLSSLYTLADLKNELNDRMERRCLLGLYEPDTQEGPLLDFATRQYVPSIQPPAGTNGYPGSGPSMTSQDNPNTSYVNQFQAEHIPPLRQQSSPFCGQGPSANNPSQIFQYEEATSSMYRIQTPPDLGVEQRMVNEAPSLAIASWYLANSEQLLANGGPLPPPFGCQAQMLDVMPDIAAASTPPIRSQVSMNPQIPQISQQSTPLPNLRQRGSSAEEEGDIWVKSIVDEMNVPQEYHEKAMRYFDAAKRKLRQSSSQEPVKKSKQLQGEEESEPNSS